MPGELESFRLERHLHRRSDRLQRVVLRPRLPHAAVVTVRPRRGAAGRVGEVCLLEFDALAPEAVRDYPGRVGEAPGCIGLLPLSAHPLARGQVRQRDVEDLCTSGVSAPGGSRCDVDQGVRPWACNPGVVHRLGLRTPDSSCSPPCSTYCLGEMLDRLLFDSKSSGQMLDLLLLVESKCLGQVYDLLLSRSNYFGHMLDVLLDKTCTHTCIDRCRYFNSCL